MDEPWQLIWNPTAGLGRADRLRGKIDKLLDDAGVPFEFHATRAAGHGLDIAAARREAGRLRFLVAGGDGSVNEVVNGLFCDGVVGEAPILAALPLGSGNDWSRSQGLPAAPETLIAWLQAGKTRSCDAGLIGATGAQKPWQRYFVNAMGTGLDVRVLQSLPRWRPAVLRYAVGLTKAFATYRASDIHFDCDGCAHTFRALAVICALGAYSGGGMCLTPHANDVPGKLAVNAIDDLPWWRLLISFRQIYDGTLGQRPEVHFMHGCEVEFKEPQGALIEADGEIIGTVPARVSILPGALRTIKAPRPEADRV